MAKRKKKSVMRRKPQNRYKERVGVTLSPEIVAYAKGNVAKGLTLNLSHEIEEAIIARMYLLGDLEDE